MKRIFVILTGVLLVLLTAVLSLTSATAASYYLDADAPGTSTTCTALFPCKTLTNLSLVSPADTDTIYLDSCDIFRGKISSLTASLTSNGTCQGKARIFGSYNKSVSSDWVLNATNIWETSEQMSYKTNNGQVSANLLFYNTERYIAGTGSPALGNKETTWSGLDTEYDYFFNSTTNKTYVYSPRGNPATYWSGIEISFEEAYWGDSVIFVDVGVKNITVSKIHISFSNTQAFNSYKAINLTFFNNTIEYTYEKGLTFQGTHGLNDSRYFVSFNSMNFTGIKASTNNGMPGSQGEGIFGYKISQLSVLNNTFGINHGANINFVNVTNFKVMGNKIYGSEYDSTLAGCIYPESSKDGEISYNYCERNQSGLYLGIEATSRSSSNISVHHNVFVAPVAMMINPTVTGVLVRNISIEYNTFVCRDTSTSYGQDRCIYIHRFDNLTFKNNIVYIDSNSTFALINYNNSNSWRSDYNLWYATSGSPQWDPFSGTTTTTLADFRTATGNESNSRYADPTFKNFASGDYTPQAGSQACDTAMGSNDIGAYSCQDSLPVYLSSSSDRYMNTNDTLANITAVTYGDFCDYNYSIWNSTQANKKELFFNPLDINETDGNFYDYSGHNSNATCTGTSCPGYQAACTVDGSGCLNFSENGDMLQLSNNIGNFSNTTSFTIDFWFNSRDNATSGNFDVIGGLIGNMNAAGNDGWMIGLFNFTVNTRQALRLKAQWKDDVASVSNNIVCTTNLTNNNWYHVALRKDSSNWSIYLDGTHCISTTNNGNIQIHANRSVWIGAFNGTSVSSSFNGSIDRIRISNYSRSDAQILETYDSVQEGRIERLMSSETGNKEVWQVGGFCDNNLAYSGITYSTIQIQPNSTIIDSQNYTIRFDVGSTFLINYSGNKNFTYDLINGWTSFSNNGLVNYTTSVGQDWNITMDPSGCILPTSNNERTITTSGHIDACTGKYYTYSTSINAVFKFAPSVNNIVFDCNNAEYVGNSSGRGLRSTGITNLTIQNCKVQNYSENFVAQTLSGQSRFFTLRNVSTWNAHGETVYIGSTNYTIVEYITSSLVPDIGANVSHCLYFDALSGVEGEDSRHGIIRYNTFYNCTGSNLHINSANARRVYNLSVYNNTIYNAEGTETSTYKHACVDNFAAQSSRFYNNYCANASRGFDISYNGYGGFAAGTLGWNWSAIDNDYYGNVFDDISTAAFVIRNFTFDNRIYGNTYLDKPIIRFMTNSNFSVQEDTPNSLELSGIDDNTINITFDYPGLKNVTYKNGTFTFYLSAPYDDIRNASNADVLYEQVSEQSVVFNSGDKIEVGNYVYTVPGGGIVGGGGGGSTTPAQNNTEPEEEQPQSGFVTPVNYLSIIKAKINSLVRSLNPFPLLNRLIVQPVSNLVNPLLDSLVPDLNSVPLAVEQPQPQPEPEPVIVHPTEKPQLTILGMNDVLLIVTLMMIGVLVLNLVMGGYLKKIQSRM